MAGERGSRVLCRGPRLQRVTARKIRLTSSVGGTARQLDLRAQDRAAARGQRQADVPMVVRRDDRHRARHAGGQRPRCRGVAQLPTAIRLLPLQRRAVLQADVRRSDSIEPADDPADRVYPSSCMPLPATPEPRVTAPPVLSVRVLLLSRLPVVRFSFAVQHWVRRLASQRRLTRAQRRGPSSTAAAATRARPLRLGASTALAAYADRPDILPTTDRRGSTSCNFGQRLQRRRVNAGIPGRRRFSSSPRRPFVHPSSTHSAGARVRRAPWSTRPSNGVVTGHRSSSAAASS